MGRSVAYHSHSMKTVYIDNSDARNEHDFEYLISDIINALQREFPSLVDDRASGHWPEREVRQIAGNGLVTITVSNYAGLVSVCFVPRWDVEWAHMAAGWAAMNTDKFEEALEPWKPMYKAGTFSNGNSVYRRA